MLTNGQVQGHVLHAQHDSHVGGVSSGSAYIHEQHIFKYFSPQFCFFLYNRIAHHIVERLYAATVYSTKSIFFVACYEWLVSTMYSMYIYYAISEKKENISSYNTFLIIFMLNKYPNP